MPPPRTPTVLIDATPLRTPSGVRGIGRYVYELLHGLRDERRNWEDRVRFVVLESLGARGQVELSDDLAGTADRAIEQRGAVPNSTMRRRRQLWLGAAATKAGADLLHQTEALGVPLACPVPRLVTCYDLIPLHYPRHYLPTPAHFPLQWVKDWRRYAGARRVVTISERTRDDVLRILKIPGERVQAVPTGIDLQRWSNQPADGDAEHLQALGLRPRSFLAYVGYGDFRKNAEGMFSTLAIARKQADLSLVWAGVLSKKLLGRLQKKAERAGVLAHVKFVGFVSDEALGALYRGSIAHLVARGSGADEVAGEAGFVVGPDDSNAAAEAVLALRDEEQRTRAGETCRARVALFGRGVMARGYVDEYLRALQNT
jgi:glycosyltransferase involved in cell wall biosynthesis